MSQKTCRKERFVLTCYRQQVLTEQGVYLIQWTVTRAFPEASVLCEISLNHNINHYSDIVILQGSRLTSKTFFSFHNNADTFILLPFILFNIYIYMYVVVVVNEGSELFRLTSFLLILMVLLFSLQTLGKVICLHVFKADIALPGYQ